MAGMQVHVDYSEVPGIPHNLTLQFVNNFIVNTTQFLNKFAINCDDKLREVHNRIQRLEITMNILDAKLNSIEGLDQLQAASTTRSDDPSTINNSSTAQHAYSHSNGIDTHSDTASQIKGASSGAMKNKDDPRYAKYFKMLTVEGHPLAHVQNKMMMDGVDPSILDDPEGFSGGAKPSDGPHAAYMDDSPFGSEADEPEEWDD